jgi:hypothetical protein
MFRPCPSYPGYSVTADGVVRRDEYPSKTRGAPPVSAKIVKRVGDRGAYVLVDRKWTRPEAMVNDAWNNALAGYVHYDDYRVITIQRPPVEGFE